MKNQKAILRTLLRSLIVTRRAEFPVVALCLLAATTFWFLNALNKEYTTHIAYPVTFDYDRDELISKVPLPDKLNLNVTGYGWTLLRKSLNIDARPVVLRIENPLRIEYITGAGMLPSVAEQLKEARINYVETDTIPVAFDRRATKKVALQVDSLQVELRENHFITSPVHIIPDAIVFEGPASLVKKLPDVLILNVPGKDIDDPYEDEIAINYTQDPLITLSTDRVTVRFNVSEFVPQIVQVPVNALRLPSQKLLKMPIKTAEVEYWVGLENASKITADDFEIVADLARWDKRDSSLPLVIIRKPDNARYVSLRTPSVKLVK